MVTKLSAGESMPSNIEVAHFGYLRYERISWFPVLLVFLVALGVGGNNLSNPPASEPVTAGSVLSFASVIAGFVLTYSPLGSDYTTYMVPEVNRYDKLHMSRASTDKWSSQLACFLMVLSWVSSTYSMIFSELVVHNP